MSKATFNPTKFNNSDNEPFASILEKRMSRRGFVVKGGSGLAAMSMLGGFGLTGCGSSDSSNSNNEAFASELNFTPIAGSLTDAVAIPEGYTAQVFAPWGTPLNRLANAFQSDGSNSSVDQENAVGMHHDGMHFFPLDGSSSEGLLCINHEYIDTSALHADGEYNSETRAPVTAEAARKQINAHGVSVVRVRLTGNEWVVVEGDVHNRRFTGASVMDLAGPVAGVAATVTPYSRDGMKARGTLNNCGNGHTPWGTYLTCEENWPGYFFAEEATQTADQQRIGVSSSRGRYGWELFAGDASESDDEFTRFNATPTGNSAIEDYRNEVNGHGYIVEIDPYDPNSTPVKRTAMGRFRHEGVAYGKLEAGKPVSFYSGHDARFEYIYKFESAALWDPADATPDNRLATGAKYMDEGTLYVARFNDNGAGEWLPLTLSSPTTNGGTLADSFDSLEAIIINTAGAADLVGATPMDRPEWTAVDPVTGTVYLTLTNNTRRTEETGTNVANPRLNNAYGHIIRWDDDAQGNGFSWDIFVYGSADVDVDGNKIPAEINRSDLTEMTQFASPDGLVFDGRGIMWIQTDNGADDVEQYTNDQMIAVIPSQLKTTDGEFATISSDNQAELKRFFVGPNGCEVTGLAFTPDYTSFFVNIQHPGNWPFSNDAAQETPEGTQVRPRAATVVIRKTDGGPIGV
ncbi:PhoX family protein [Bacterioplanoides sp.]|uniref:PhoX family protein n=1 Tax=Bacterioplanoides sp. TaxID=2066072 RepID=UPI003AFFC9E5